MSKFKTYKGDIWDLEDHVVVVPINMQGVMGRGIARQARDKFIIIEEWAKLLISKKYNFAHSLPLFYGMSTCSAYKDVITTAYHKSIIPFPVKFGFKEQANISLIRKSAFALGFTMDCLHHSEKVALPQVGCGFGELEWYDVKKLIYEVLIPFQDRIIIVKPNKYLITKYPESFKKGAREDKHGRVG